MIDYELLCQTIEDWRAGRRPSIDLSATPVGAGAVEDYAELEAEPGYDDQGQYEGGQSYDGYGGYEYDGAPSSVPGSGTSPMEVNDVEYEQ